MPDSVIPPKSAANRPAVSRQSDGPDGRQFSVTFTPGQRLPTHRNASRVVITAVSGDGEIDVEGIGMRSLPTGAVVQVEPNVAHAVVAGEGGLELIVRLVHTDGEPC